MHREIRQMQSLLFSSSPEIPSGTTSANMNSGSIEGLTATIEHQAARLSGLQHKAPHHDQAERVRHSSIWHRETPPVTPQIPGPEVARLGSEG
jgi:hypothetical protein